MITDTERAFITRHAYVPEHLPHYVTSIARTEPFLLDDFVAHLSGANLIFVGYPLTGNFEAGKMLDGLKQARARFDASHVSLLAPPLPHPPQGCSSSSTDSYFRLDLANLRLPKKTRNMLARARREVTIETGTFGREHRRLVDEFLRAHRLEAASRFIFQRVSEYAKCQSTLVFEARTARGDLAAFDIAEFGARAYAFYMFNFRARKHSVPGVSDLLLAHIIEHAQAEGKRFLNLGLGIHAGVTFFKTKWGATPFLEHVAYTQDVKAQPSWNDMLELLARF
ncbi:MAG: hypothetical protein Fur0043_24750 [Anaerolineales bacterium]